MLFTGFWGWVGLVVLPLAPAGSFFVAAMRRSSMQRILAWGPVLAGMGTGLPAMAEEELRRARGGRR